MSRRETTRVGVSHQCVTNPTSPLRTPARTVSDLCEVWCDLVWHATPSHTTPHTGYHTCAQTRTGTTQSVSGCHQSGNLFQTLQSAPERSGVLRSAPGAFRSVWSGIPLQTAPEGKKCSNLRVWKEARFSGRKLAKIGRFACRFQPPSTPTQI